MPLREKFLEALRGSQSFQALSSQDQEELLATYKNAHEAALERGLEIIQTIETELDAKLKQIEADKVKLAKEIKVGLVKLVKEDRIADEAKDHQQSAQILGDLEKQIGAL